MSSKSASWLWDKHMSGYKFEICSVVCSLNAPIRKYEAEARQKFFALPCWYMRTRKKRKLKQEKKKCYFNFFKFVKLEGESSFLSKLQQTGSAVLLNCY